MNVRALLLPVLVAACQATPNAAPVDPQDALDALPTSEVPVPAGTLLNLGAVAPGASVTLQVTNAPGWATVKFYATGVGLGVGPCAPGGAPCLGLLQPKLLGTKVAGPGGRAAITITVPRNLPAEVWFQATTGNRNLQLFTVSNIVDRAVDDMDLDGFAAASDCDDADPDVNPGALELPADGIDQDCDGSEDCYVDADGDGWGADALVSSASLTCDAAGVSDVSGDCADDDDDRYPFRPEFVADLIDQDCDGIEICYLDADGDGFGGGVLEPSSDATCTNGLATTDTDCFDDDPAYYPTAVETCGDPDLNCDGVTHDDDIDQDGAYACEDCGDNDPARSPLLAEIPGDGIDQDCDATEACYVDMDGDHVGTAVIVDSATLSCMSAGIAPVTGDCNDASASIGPNAVEVVADGVDQDCDGQEDCYLDQDADGFGSAVVVSTAQLTCTGFALTSNDCDDTDADAHPGAAEVCGDPDLNCDGVAQDDDADGDGSFACDDCDDADPARYPGATEVCGDADLDCDGIAQDDDADGDGSADCEDCDDADDAVFPGAVELCNSIDDDCDGTIDGELAWWDAAWPYRFVVEVTAPASNETNGLPVSVDLDFGAALAALGDASGLRAESIRVVNQSCDLGQPVLPSELVDDMAGLFDTVPSTDPVGDDAGAVVFRMDNDGDYTTSELFTRNTRHVFAVYFGSNDTSPGVTAPTYPTGMVTSGTGATATLSNTLTESTYASGQGGLPTRVAVAGGTTTGAQTSNTSGNGVYFGPAAAGAWASARSGTGVTLSVVHSGPVFGAVRSTGTLSNASGGATYTYTWLLFDGRPEIYGKVAYVLDRASTVGAPPTFTHWGAAVRVWAVNNNALATSVPSSDGYDNPGYRWVRGTYDTAATPYGIATGYRSSVALRARPLTDAVTPGRLLGLSGQDFDPTFDAAETTLSGQPGDVLVDNAIFAVYPHAGAFTAVSQDFFGVLSGPSTSVSPAEAQ